MDYDTVVIGSGPGGYIAATRLRQLGKKTACIERASEFGGTCLNVGCIPSKTLLHSSMLYARFQDEAAKHGVLVESHPYNFPELMTKKTEVVEGMQEQLASLFLRHGVDVLSGTAKIIDPHTIQITKDDGGIEIVKAASIVLATGSRPIPLPFAPFDEKMIVSTTGALSLESVPKRLVVVGAGSTGVELASVYARLGSCVTIIEHLSEICAPMDSEVADRYLKILQKQKMNFLTSTQVLAIKKKEQSLELWLRPASGEELVIEADICLVAIGRTPNSQNLGLSELEVEMTARGAVIVDKQLRTSIPSIYAIGDLTEGPRQAQRAMYEGEKVAEIIAGNPQYIDYQGLPDVVYTTPEVAKVGLTEKEAKSFGRKVLVGKSSFRINPRGRLQDERDGFVKVIADGETNRLMGMHIIANHASELISIGSLALSMRAKVTDLAELAFAHPTFSEAIKDASLHALGRSFH